MTDTPVGAPVEVVQAETAPPDTVEQAIEIMQEQVAAQEPVPVMAAAPSEDVPVIVPVPEDKPVVIVKADTLPPESVPEPEEIQNVVAPAASQLVQAPAPTAEKPVVVVVKEEAIANEQEQPIAKTTVAALAPQAMPAIVLTAPSEDDVRTKDEGLVGKIAEAVAKSKPISIRSIGQNC